jgi:Domain of unknown function (DUF4410)
MRTLALALVAMLMSGCVTPQVTTAPTGPVDFTQYKKVKVAVTDGVNTPYAKEGMPMFEGLLKGRIESLGHAIVYAQEDMALQVTVSAFDPGNRAARTLVGFGAGRAILTYAASFRGPSGNVIAELEGGKSYHGMELTDNPLFKTDEGIRMGMIQDAVIQIGQFMKNNGKLE